MIVEYLADEPITLAEVRAQCRVDEDDTSEDNYLSGVVIPAARALAEAKSGSAIRRARYSETVADVGACVLAVGEVREIESVKVAGADVAYTSTTKARRTYITAASYPGKVGEVTYTAGIDIAKHPGVKSWMLLVCGWLYRNREMIDNLPMHEVPQHIADSLLSSISVPAGF